jgi:methionine-rich copper-binding protein CopC
MIIRITLLLVALLASEEAQAHAFLLKSNPAVGSVMTRPATLSLEFSEAIELIFSGVDVLNASGTPIKIEQLRFADNSHKVLVAALPVLAPGAYHVKWHVVSADTHRTEGDFTFTVKP